ncbi:hypothetical protein THRCLA_08788 [Thraustotheca clavata]|uniref:Uncharacterized protein n=1 Tax=Thraustotheca clavata TaxID=74557 RepID=A0A1V9Z2C5_9STRA|nr:hypothetical protein THRCLA_08788 [Thraustotheca clavata]
MVVDSSSSPRSTTSSSSSSSEMDLMKPVEGKGTWTKEEHDRFLKAIEMYPNGPWKAIAESMDLKSKLQDSRASQLLEPVRVPLKLQERLEKAQKRFMNKDDFFFDSTKGTNANTTASNKKHLPDVILRNKMMAFEAKWKCKNKTSAYFDPLDTSLDRLTIEERDEVMNRVQSKVEEITEHIEAKYRKKKHDLDHQGVFDTDTNFHRVQTMCLVEIQRKCNVDRIKEQVLEAFEHERNPLAAKPKSRKTPLNVIDVLLKDVDNIEAKGPKKLQRMLRNQNQEQPHESVQVPINNQTADIIETKTKAEIIVVVVPSTKPAPVRAMNEDLSEKKAFLNRHPQVLAVIATLRANDVASKRPRRRTIVRQGDDAASRPVTAISEWKERPKIFMDMGVRCTMELHHRSEKQLWDFTTILPDYSELHSRLAPLLNAWKERQERKPGEANSIGDEKCELLNDRRRRCDQEYFQRQTAIKERLRRDHAASAPVLPTINAVDPPIVHINTVAPPKENSLMEYRRALINSRPTTLLDVRLNQLVHRKLTRSISTTGTINLRNHQQKLPVGHRTLARSQARKKNAMTWEWQVAAPQETKELQPVISIPQQINQTAIQNENEASSSTSPSKAKLHRAPTMNLGDGQRVPLQSRLEQLWADLDMPYHLKLSMLEKYAMQEEPELFQTALLHWEKAAQVILLRERILGLLRSVHQSWLGNELKTMANKLDQMLLHKLHIALPLEWTPVIFETWATMALPIITERCQELSHRLYSVTGDELTFQGKRYPSES